MGLLSTVGAATVRHFWHESPFRTSQWAAADPVEFVPAPQMTDAQIQRFSAPRGRASTLTRGAYITEWVLQLAAVIVAVVLLSLLVTEIVSGTQDKVDSCREGLDRCSVEGAGTPGLVLGLIACIAVVVLGRPTRRQIAAQMLASARRAAAVSRQQLQPFTVIVDHLSPRGRWLVTTAHRMLDNYPPTAADRVLWDIARRLDAAAHLQAMTRRRPVPAELPAARTTATALSDQAERDIARLRRAVQTGGDYRHQPPRTKSTSSLPRSTDRATTISDAQLLLPRNMSPLEGASS